MKTQAVIRQLLLGFVLLSIGFALGRQSARRAVPTGGEPAPTATTKAAEDNKVVVYYLHGAVRCVTCNKIEALAKETLQAQFADELKSGRLEWKTADFQEDEDLAQRYDIVSSTLVLVRRQGGKDVQFEKLDDVWRLVNNKPDFAAYVQGKVRSCLEAGQ